MSRIKQWAVMAVILSGISGSLLADETEKRLELTRTALLDNRKAVVTENMQLTAAESKAFWPLYNEYRSARNKVGDRTLKLIRTYAEHYNQNTMTDEIASTLMREWLSIENAELKLKKKYVKKFERVLPPKKLVRYFQIENKLDAMVDAQLAAEIPLVE